MVGEERERRGGQWEKLDESEGNFDLKITYLIFFRVFTNNRERGTRRTREGGNERKKKEMSMKDKGRKGERIFLISTIF